MKLKNLRNVLGVVGGFVACGAVGGLQQETLPLLQGTLCMILGILIVAACMHNRD
jgi:cytochrome c biogenesis protein CcdA